MHIAKGGTSWILTSIFVFIVVSVLALFSSDNLQYILYFLSFITGLVSIIFLIFFRDPQRNIGSGVVAVADGIIRETGSITDKDCGDAWYISTFMNLYHVHVNRMPVDGTIKQVTHIPGSHLPAFTKESDRNERVIILVETMNGIVKIVLIAGTLARRIVPYVTEGQKVKKGEKISLIRLGSRVDVYLPKKMMVTLQVQKKDRVQAGGSSLATSHV